MNLSLKKLLQPYHLDYVIVNQDFLVLEASSGTRQFTDSGWEVSLYQDIRLYFPELIGLENKLQGILQGQQKSFELKGILKLNSQNQQLYVDLCMVSYDPGVSQKILIIIEDVTDKMNLAQELGQVAKEYSLLIESHNLTIQQLSIYKEYLDKTVAAITDILLVVNASGIIKKVNQAAINLLGYQETELIGQTIQNLFAPKSQQLPEIQAYIFPQDFCAKATQIIWKTKTNHQLIVSLSCSEIKSEQQTIPDFVCIGHDITQQKQAENFQQQQIQQNHLLRTIGQQIRQSLKLEDILATTVEKVRQFLNCDRVIIGQYLPNGQMKIEVESLAINCQSLRGKVFPKLVYLPEQESRFYRQGQPWGITDLDTTSLATEHREILEKLQVRAELVVPILNSGELWGLLVAHHCCQARYWQPWEQDLIEQLNNELAIAIHQAELYEQLQNKNRELLRLTTLDELTQLSNRRHFNQYIYKEWRRLAREQQPLSLIMCDVDYFKLYNDNYGHLDGDLCLQRVASMLQDSIRRPADLAARYGGEEFAIILPNTEAQGAVGIAEKICHRIKSMEIPHQKSPICEYVTLSMGVACQIPQPQMPPETLVNAADQALYQAKEQGRNQVKLGTQDIYFPESTTDQQMVEINPFQSAEHFIKHQR